MKREAIRTDRSSSTTKWPIRNRRPHYPGPTFGSPPWQQRLGPFGEMSHFWQPYPRLLAAPPREARHWETDRFPLPKAPVDCLSTLILHVFRVILFLFGRIRNCNHATNMEHLESKRYFQHCTPQHGRVKGSNPFVPARKSKGLRKSTVIPFFVFSR